jgi:hypothetical protein
VGALGVADLGEVLLSVGEDLALVDTTELEVDAKVLLVEGLEEGVEETGEERGGDLLDDLSTGLASIVFRSDRGELVLVEVVLGAVLVGGSDDEGEAVDGEVEGTEDSGDDVAVVVGAGVNELDRSLEVVEESVNVCEKKGQHSKKGKVSRRKSARNAKTHRQEGL